MNYRTSYGHPKVMEDEAILRSLQSYLDELPTQQKAAAARIIENAKKGRFTAGWQAEAEEIIIRHRRDRYGILC